MDNSCGVVQSYANHSPFGCWPESEAGNHDLLCYQVTSNGVLDGVTSNDIYEQSTPGIFAYVTYAFMHFEYFQPLPCTETTMGEPIRWAPSCTGSTEWRCSAKAHLGPGEIFTIKQIIEICSMAQKLSTALAFCRALFWSNVTSLSWWDYKRMTTKRCAYLMC